MHVFSPRLLTISFLLSCLTALPAAAQPCGEAINGQEIAIGLEKSIGNVFVTVYDSTGTAIRAVNNSPLGPGLATIPLVTMTGHPCAALIDFPPTGAADPTNNPNVIVYENPGRIATVEFSYLNGEGAAQTYRIVYGGNASGQGASFGCEGRAGTFFCPFSSTVVGGGRVEQPRRRSAS